MSFDRRGPRRSVVRGRRALGVRLFGAPALLCSLLTGCALAPQRDQPNAVCADPAFERELVDLIRAGIATKEPNTARILTRGRDTLFDGSYDWHSCVIGHWVLSVSARVRGDDELATWLDERLTVAALEHESTLLLEPDPFARITWPYDEAWFCLLLAELDRRADDERWHALRRRHEAHLVAALAVLPFPDHVTPVEDPRERAAGEPARTRTLDGPFCGFYRSWSWAWLALAWCEPLDSDVRAEHRALWRERVVPHLDAIAAIERGHGYDFLWVPALADLAARTPAARGAPPPPPYRLPDTGPLPDAVVVATVHVLGVHLTRAWPLADAHRRGDRAGRRAYEEVVGALVRRRDLWAEAADGGFDAATHWLPQYLFVGEWLAAGRP